MLLKWWRKQICRNQIHEYTEKGRNSVRILSILYICAKQNHRMHSLFNIQHSLIDYDYHEITEKFMNRICESNMLYLQLIIKKERIFNLQNDQET